MNLLKIMSHKKSNVLMTIHAQITILGISHKRKIQTQLSNDQGYKNTKKTIKLVWTDQKNQKQNNNYKYYTAQSKVIPSKTTIVFCTDICLKWLEF